LSSIGVSSSSWDHSDAGGLSATFAPGLDYFFVPNVSLGLDMDVAYSDTRGYGADGSLVETRATAVAAGPRLGLNVPMGRIASFYPQITTGLESTRTTESLVSGPTLSIAGATGYPTTTRFGPWIKVYAPVLFHPVPHFFLGAGPYLFREFGPAQGGPQVGDQRTVLSAAFVLGGTLGGPAEDDPDDPPGAPAGGGRRFGSKGQVVIDGDIDTQTTWTWYSGIGSSAFYGTFQPGVDFFVTDHLSLGVAPYVSYEHGNGVDASTGAAVSYTTTSFGIEHRIGLDVPVGNFLSWYPRVGLVYGADTYDETSGPSENSPISSRLALHVYAPLLVHAAPHLFVGFGPSLFHDFVRAVQPTGGPTEQNRNTTIGVSLVVGAGCTERSRDPCRGRSACRARIQPKMSGPPCCPPPPRTRPSPPARPSAPAPWPRPATR
jgi:hypothetical protein